MQKTNFKTRLLALLTAAFMLVMCVPFAALADDPDMVAVDLVWDKDQVEVTDLDGKSLGEYEAWFNGNIIYSYFTSDYPWTRLGYTYDWAEDSDEYGLTEFLILGGTSAEVGFTMTTDEFIRYMADIA